MKLGKGIRLLAAALVLVVAAPARAEKLTLPPGASAIVEKIYSFQLEEALQDTAALEEKDPAHPAGYLLEGEARWWRIWCGAADFKYGLNDARRRAKLSEDAAYFQLASKVTKLAEDRLRARETAEMHFYAGMGESMAARLYAVRGENRNTARAGVRAREHFVRARALDSGLVDAEFGLGLYNYYVDTLSTIARMLRFFMGIPGGSKAEGIQQLQRAAAEGAWTGEEARFYLAMNLCRYDREYERALATIEPLVEKYPGNPIFQLVRGDFLAKLNRKELAARSYREAAGAATRDARCRDKIQQLVKESLEALGQGGPAD